jgi:DNA polymerase phi
MDNELQIDFVNMASVLNKDKDFLQCFWDLALSDSNVRVAAAARLVTFVKNNLENERDYALKRLVKGLASSRDSARHGFSTCLAEFLQLPGVTVATVLDLLDSSTKVNSVRYKFNVH